MGSAIALIRGINVGGKNPLPMALVRELCGEVGWADARTYIQSGNVVFECAKRALEAGAARLEAAIERERGFRPRVVVRTAEEWRSTMEASPFAGRRGVEPGKLLVMFLAGRPAAGAAGALGSVKRGREEVALLGRELHVYFPDGVGRSKLSLAAVERALGVEGTARNWSTVGKLLEMAEEPAVRGWKSTLPSPRCREERRSSSSSA